MSLTYVSVHNLHHSVEFALKAGIIKKKTSSLYDTTFVKDLWKIKHDLTKLWPIFKESFPALSLNKFDVFIAQLDDWDTNPLRYPDGRPQGLHIVWGSGDNYFEDKDKAKHITAVLDMNFLDKFIHTLWTTIDFNQLESVLRYIVTICPQCRDTYKRQNKFSLRLDDVQPNQSGKIVAEVNLTNQSDSIPPSSLLSDPRA